MGLRTIFGAAVLSSLAIVTMNCAGPGASVETLEGLVAGLKRAGVQIEAEEALDLSEMKDAEIEKGVALVGEKLRVDVLYIVDDRTYRMAEQAGAMLTDRRPEQLGTSVTPPMVFARSPYVVVIREEPRKGQVMEALEKLLPRTGAAS